MAQVPFHDGGGRTYTASSCSGTTGAGRYLERLEISGFLDSRRIHVQYPRLETSTGPYPLVLQRESRGATELDPLIDDIAKAQNCSEPSRYQGERGFKQRTCRQTQISKAAKVQELSGLRRRQTSRMVEVSLLRWDSQELLPPTTPEVGARAFFATVFGLSFHACASDRHSLLLLPSSQLFFPRVCLFLLELQRQIVVCPFPQRYVKRIYTRLFNTSGLWQNPSVEYTIPLNLYSLPLPTSRCLVLLHRCLRNQRKWRRRASHLGWMKFSSKATPGEIPPVRTRC